MFKVKIIKHFPDFQAVIIKYILEELKMEK